MSPVSTLTILRTSHRSCRPSPSSLLRSGMTPGEVLVRFLAFFGRQFDASRVGISVGRGALNNPFALSPSVDPRTGMPVMDAHLVIEDPLDRDQNVARSCFGFPQVRRMVMVMVMFLVGRAVQCRPSMHRPWCLKRPHAGWHFLVFSLFLRPVHIYEDDTNAAARRES